jgi:XTP/dITP diphosphohydrolase
LGDLLLHIVFYARLGKEHNQFQLADVITGICEKLISRHPHIYGDVKVSNADDVKKNWEKLKLKEGKKSVISGVPVSLPATVKAMRLQEKAKQVGFEWENKDQVWEKVEEEIGELKSAIEAQDTVKIEEEFGDVIFSMINYARFLQIDAENALEKTNRKFIHRFSAMEQQAMHQGKDLNQMSLQEMDELWNIIKKRRENP